MAESTKKIPRSKETAGKKSVLKQATERLNREFSLPENSGDLEAFLQANEAIMNGLAALSSEMMAFRKKRLREPFGPPASVVLTLWLSMIAALGLACLPTVSRTSWRSVS